MLNITPIDPIILPNMVNAIVNRKRIIFIDDERKGRMMEWNRDGMGEVDGKTKKWEVGT